MTEIQKTLSDSHISRKCEVSRQAVNTWKMKAKSKGNLALSIVNSRIKIVDSVPNWRELDRLKHEAWVKSGRVETVKSVKVPFRFFDIFSENEQKELVDDLRKNKNINSKFVYKERGAMLWNEDYYNLNKPTITLLEQQKRYIEDVIKQPVNIVDLGCGNGEPAKWFFDNFKIKDYLGIDGSDSMNKLCSGNIEKWNKNIKSEFRTLDFQTCHYSDLTFNTRSTNKITLLLGDTLCIFEDRKQIFTNISKGMEKSDLFIFDFSLNTRQGYGDFLKHVKHVEERNGLKIARNDPNDLPRGWILSLMGVNLKNCDIEYGFDSEKSQMFKRAVMDTNYNIDFGFDNVELKAGDRIYRWIHKTIDEKLILQELEDCNLQKVSSVSFGHNCVYICRLKG